MQPHGQTADWTLDYIRVNGRLVLGVTGGGDAR